MREGTLDWTAADEEMIGASRSLRALIRHDPELLSQLRAQGYRPHRMSLYLYWVFVEKHPQLGGKGRALGS